MSLIADVYIGLGSNLSDPVRQVTDAIGCLNDIPETTVVTASSLYASCPMGPQNQPDFINAVAQVRTGLTPHALLSALLGVERRQGRNRPRPHRHLTHRGEQQVQNTIHWGPRVIDLDLLLFGDETVKTENLTIPHPGLFERDFVIVPLLEIAPDLEICGYGLLAQYLNKARSYQLKKLTLPAKPEEPVC